LNTGNQLRIEAWSGIHQSVIDSGDWSMASSS